MKAEMPTRAVVVIIIAVIVLAAMSFFIYFQSGAAISEYDAQAAFTTSCETYKKAECSWSVTYEKGFEKFLDACRKLYGNEREAFSCLISMCCQEVKFTDVQCAGLCKLCKGNFYSGVKTEDCCSIYAGKCKTDCEVC